eukprot:gene13078-13205_t
MLKVLKVLLLPHGLTPDQQRLVFLGKVLEPSKTLDYYGVQPQHSLLLAARLAGTAASPTPAAAGSDSFYAPMFEGDATPLLRVAAAGGDGNGDDEGASSNVKLVPVPAIRRSSLGVAGQEEADGADDDSAAAAGGGETGGSGGSSRTLVVRDVRQLKSHVAHGAAQLALGNDRGAAGKADDDFPLHLITGHGSNALSGVQQLDAPPDVSHPPPEASLPPGTTGFSSNLGIHGGGFETVLLINEASAHGDDPISQVAWGGDNALRVIVWWPTVDAATGSYRVGAEIIRMPPANALETGMLDLSAFGGFGGPSESGAESSDWDVPPGMTWPKLRALGAGFWLTEPQTLRATAEGLAKAQYARAKDPHEPALLYAALGKKTVLQGLFRSSGNKKVADFLARDFTTVEGQAAASKNAFALLGQHRHSLAAAFFILAGSGWDAVSRLGLSAEPSATAVVLARHYLALNPITALPIQLPGSNWCSIPAQAADGVGSSCDGAAASLPASTAAAAGGLAAGYATPICAGPDAVLAICLSRTSSTTDPPQQQRISAAAASHAAAAAASLKAHMHQPGAAGARPRPLVGSSTGGIYLWSFGEALCKAAYVPSTASQAVSTPHWGAPAAVRFSRSGGRFGAVGEGGLVGLWRQDFISAVDGLGHAEWVCHCLSKAGTGITFLGDTGSQVVVSGVGDHGGLVVLADSLAPPSSCLVASLASPRGSTPTAITLVPGNAGAGPGAVLVVGEDSGEVRGFDVRALAEGRPLWTAKPYGLDGSSSSSSGRGVTCLTFWDPVTGEGGGVVPLWRPVPAGAAAAAVVDVAACGEGVVSVGGDGSVRFHALSHMLAHWATDPACCCCWES